MRRVVEGAIARELVDFDRRMTADQRGFWAGAKERAIQLQTSTLIARAFQFVVALSFLFGWLVVIGVFDRTDYWSTVSRIGIPATAFVLGSYVVFKAGRRVARVELESLNRDRVSAEIATQMPRPLLQEVSRSRRIDLPYGHHYFSAFERLAEMGVFEIIPENSLEKGKKSVSFELTPFGTEVWDLALAGADRQHDSHWENVAKHDGDGGGSERSG